MLVLYADIFEKEMSKIFESDPESQSGNGIFFGKLPFRRTLGITVMLTILCAFDPTPSILLSCILVSEIYEWR